MVTSDMQSLLARAGLLPNIADGDGCIFIYEFLQVFRGVLSVAFLPCLALILLLSQEHIKYEVNRLDLRFNRNHR